MFHAVEFAHLFSVKVSMLSSNTDPPPLLSCWVMLNGASVVLQPVMLGLSAVALKQHLLAERQVKDSMESSTMKLLRANHLAAEVVDLEKFKNTLATASQHVVVLLRHLHTP